MKTPKLTYLIFQVGLVHHSVIVTLLMTLVCFYDIDHL